MDKVFFSILIPVYNGQAYLAACLDSVLRQTYPHFEVVIVDDGSTDDSGAICDAYSSDDTRIHVIHQTNQGPLWARRIGIDHAVGDYCVFLDADDTLKENALSVLSAAIAEKPCDCVIFGMDRVADSRVVLAFQPEFPDKTVIRDKRELYRALFCGESFNSLCRKAVKKSVFHGFDYSAYGLRHGEDRLQTVEIAKNAASVLFLSASLYNYRMHPASMTHCEFNASFRQDYSLSRYVYDFLKKEKVFSKEDFSIYFGQYVQTMMKRIKVIAKTPCSMKDKRLAIQSYKMDDFYKVIIQSNPFIGNLAISEKLVWALFRLGMYRTIVMLCRVKNQTA